MTPLPLRALGLHLLCLGFPVLTLWLILSAPHPWWVLPIPFVLIALCTALDVRAAPSRSVGTLPTWVYDGTLVVAAALQGCTIGGLLWVTATRSLGPLDLFVTTLITGVCSGTSSIVVAHELVHRRSRAWQWLGRWLLMTSLYDHFAVEHVRGHHRRVGTPQDPATARHGEWFVPFLLRTVPGQFKSAWNLESHRLRAKHGLAHWSQHQVLVGLVLEWSALGVVALVSPLAAGAWLFQSVVAVVFLEAVNYIEHWGLVRAPGRVTALDSWDTESWFSYHTLVGLTRHADHHLHASRPYQALEYVPESIKMPYGYWGMVLGTLLLNPVIRRKMDQALKQAGLGPYRTGSTSQPAADASSA